MKLYEFNPDDAYRFAREQNIHVLLRGDELRFQHCPYCGGGPSHRDKNTFAINLVNGSFNCKRSSCGRTGNMITLHRDFGFSLGEGIDSYYDRESRYRRFKRPAEKIESKPAAVAYMESRGISRRITELYEITTKEGADNILVFPSRMSKKTFGLSSTGIQLIRREIMAQKNGVSVTENRSCSE